MHGAEGEGQAGTAQGGRAGDSGARWTAVNYLEAGSEPGRRELQQGGAKGVTGKFGRI
jgi:hypothetical protein